MIITVETEVNAPLNRVWSAWLSPADITQWNFASDDWHCPTAEVDLWEGGKFSYRMAARDNSVTFDFSGVFKRVDLHRLIQFELDDGRPVTVEFSEGANGVRVVESFEAESENPAELQKQGWQSILNNFKNHVEEK